MCKFNPIQATREKELRSVILLMRSRNNFLASFPLLFSPSVYPPTTCRRFHHPQVKTGIIWTPCEPNKERGKKRKDAPSAEPRGYVVITINDHNYAFSLASCYRVVLSRFPVSRYSAHRALKKRSESHVRWDYLSHAQENGTPRCTIQDRANMIARMGARACMNETHKCIAFSPPIVQ